MSSRLPLADLRVIDAATVLAAPTAARYLADFGADVIKVERPDGGDTTRAMGWRDLSATPGVLRWAGRAMNADRDDILRELND